MNTQFFKSKLVQLLLLVLIFSLSRLYIYSHPPLYYSDVKADYERYANMWRYGLTPYRKHLYEYPPATIPMLSLPLVLDQAGIGKYYTNYRTEIFIIDTLFFIYLLWIAGKLPWVSNRYFTSLLSYIFLTTLGKEFLYEGIDLAFTASIVVSLTLTFAIREKSYGLELVSWIFFWLSTAIKFLTLPLIIPLFLLLHRGKLLQQIIVCIIGFFIVWGLPLGLYRSSLQVSFVHNGNRPIKYAAFPAHIIRWINSFTKTETQRNVAPDFEYQGPVSEKITKIDAIIFPVSILAAVLFMFYVILRKSNTQLSYNVAEIKKLLFERTFISGYDRVAFGLYFYLLYAFTLFLTAKIFSQPFHIWYMSVVAFLPFKENKKWYALLLLCTLMILLDMTPLLHIKNNFLVFNTVEVSLIRDLFRFIPMFIILYITITELLLLSKQELNASLSKKKLSHRY